MLYYGLLEGACDHLITGLRTGATAGTRHACDASRAMTPCSPPDEPPDLCRPLSVTPLWMHARTGLACRAVAGPRNLAGSAAERWSGLWGPWARSALAQGRARMGGGWGRAGSGLVPAVGSGRARDAGPQASRPSSPQGPAMEVEEPPLMARKWKAKEVLSMLHEGEHFAPTTSSRRTRTL